MKIVATHPQYNAHIKAAEDFYGINRTELKSIRYAIFKTFRTFKIAYKALADEPTKKEVKKQLDDMISDKYLFAGMNRYFNKIL